MCPAFSATHKQLNTWRAYLALLNSGFMASQTTLRLLYQFRNIEDFLKSPAQTLIQAGISEKQAEAITHPNWKKVDQQLAWMEKTGTQMLLLGVDPNYPAQLSEISIPPLALFIKGDSSILSQAQIAMVGARKATEKGRKTAQRFAYALGEAGFIITSGLALGIDGASHQGALKASAKTIAVLGCGLDTLYPNAHAALAEQILYQGGAILSEFAPSTPPLPQHFPRRNRIISGLSLGTLVVEAALQSGSLITARYALEQGREVFAVPGAIDHPLAKGCHQLLKQGAKLVETVQDIVEELPPLF